MIIEILTSVTVRGIGQTEFITVSITEIDLIELAKQKALLNYDWEHYIAECDEIDEISIMKY